MQEHTPDSSHILKFLTIVNYLVHTDYEDEIWTRKKIDIIGLQYLEIFSKSTVARRKMIFWWLMELPYWFKAIFNWKC